MIDTIRKEILTENFPISIKYSDTNLNKNNYHEFKFDISLVKYIDDYCFGEKILAEIFNEYLNFDTLNIRGNKDGYQYFTINLRKIKIKLLLKNSI
jgi:hypothetical protein